MLKVLSPGIRKLPHLQSFLAEEFKQYADPAVLQAVVGWGHKPTADKARALACREQVPYLALEDGMLRSLDLGVNHAAPLSLSVDPVGCYYDAGGPSLIEKLLGDETWFDEALQERTERFIDFLKAHALSKYNSAPTFDTAVLAPDCAEHVLLVDQCAGDASLDLGCCPLNAAQLMLDKARQCYPHARIYLQVHPDVAAGKRQGLFDLTKLPSDITLLAAPAAPFTLLPHFKALFTVSSQLGFEALLQGTLKVHCLGLPFYAGYGLTHDDLMHERRKELCAKRKRQVSAAELAAAVYFKLCRYVNPVSGERCDAEEVAQLLACQREINEANRGLKVVYGVKRWRRAILNAYLASTGGQIIYLNDVTKALQTCVDTNATLVQWASRSDVELSNKAAALGIKQLLVEDGFVRSKGLGSDYCRPYSLVFDTKGIYYNPNQQSDIEDILNSLPQRADWSELQQRAQRLIKHLVDHRLTKYNVGSADNRYLKRLVGMAGARQRILVPGQVESDASVKAAGGSIHSNAELLQAVRVDHPEAFIVYKPHPDVLALNRSGYRAEKDCLALCDLVVTDCSIAALYDCVDEVCVLSSQSGFEALLRGKKVSVYGRPFYAGWGLTTDKQQFSSRKARLSLADLAAGVLLLYPRYFDWESGQFCRVEEVCWRLEHQAKQLSDGLWIRSVRGAYHVKRAMFRLIQGDLS